MRFFQNYKNHKKESHKKQKNHKNFLYVSFPDKTNDFIFFKSKKTLVLGQIWPFRDSPPKKNFSVTFEFIGTFNFLRCI